MADKAEDKYKGDIVAEAWDLTKTESDPEFAGIQETLKIELRDRADGVIRTGLTINAFEEKVKELNEQKKADEPPTPLGTTNALGETPPLANTNPDEVRPDGTKKQTYTEADADAQLEDVETVESLTKLSRAELDARAKQSGLDGDSYSNKEEVAKAILAAEK